MTLDDSQRHVVEQWFRRRGLPAVVHGRPTQLLLRIVPSVVFLAVLDTILDALFILDGQTDAEFEQRLDSDAYATGYSVLLLSVAVLPLAGAWLAMRWVRPHTASGTTSDRSRVIATGIVALYVLAWPVAEYLADAGDAIMPAMLLNAGLVVLIYAVAFAGGGAIAGWAARAALRQLRLLGTLTSRALPLLLLFTIFGFYTAEIWQANNALSRAQMWLLVWFFVLVSILFMTANLSDELRELSTVQPTPQSLDKLTDSPLEPFLNHRPTDQLSGDELSGDEQLPLRPAERANMLLVLLLTQAFQAVVFAMLMFGFFVTFGSLAVRPAVIKAWSTHAPTTGTLFGIQIPVPNELVQMSIFLAAFSALYFVASAASDARYRRAFLDPLVDHMAVSLTARRLYLTHWTPQPDPGTDHPRSRRRAPRTM